MPTIDKYIIIIAVSVLVFSSINFGADIQELDCTDFYRDLETGTEQQAVQTGQKIFECIESKYRADAGFVALKSKMIAAESLANQMINQLKKATHRQIFAVAGELFKDKAKEKSKDSLSVAPAKSLYETSQHVFSKKVNTRELENEEKKFLAKFYDFKLRILTSEIAKAGRALAIAEPSFKGTYDYVLVLPLLHTSETKPVNIDVLPKWMRKSNQLNVFSDSCLMHYGFVYHAQAFAKAAAELDKEDFSQRNFYKSASKKCAKQIPHVAVNCLKKAIDLIDENEINEKIALKFDIVQIWMDSDNFKLAAGEAKSIIDNFPDHKRASRAIWLYFYALSRANDVDTILSNIDKAIADPRCSGYIAKLMYMKWWALRSKKDKTAQIAALEHQLINDYGDNVLVAPIVLSRATDLLARQDYGGALALLEQIQEKFPFTATASQAKKIVRKLKTIQGTK